MPYTPDTWANNDPTKPLNAARLTKLAGQYPQVMTDLPAKIADSGDPIGVALSSTIGSVAATAMSNPESELQSETIQVVEGVLGGGVAGLVRVEKGTLTDIATARPAWAGIVEWWVPAGSADPVYIADGDIVTEVEVIPAPWTPLRLGTALYAWWDPTALAGAGGSTVTTLPDFGPNGIDLTAANGFGTVTIDAAGINSTKTLSFAGEASLQSGAITRAPGFTRFFVLSVTGSGSQTQWVMAGRNTSDSAWRQLLSRGTAATWNFAGSGTILTGPASNTSVHVIQVTTTADGSGSFIRVDNDAPVSGTTGANTLNRLALGPGATGLNLNAKIGNVIVVNGTPSSGDRDEIVAFLKAKHGIA